MTHNHDNQHQRIVRTLALALATASLLATASCASPASRATTAETILGSESSDATTTSSATTGDADTNTNTNTNTDTDTVALVKQLVSERKNLPIDTLEVDDPFTLEPSTCVLWSARPTNLIDYGAIPVVFLNDDPAPDLVVGDGGKHDLGTVAQRCFIDHGLVPTPDVAVNLVIWLAGALPPLTIAYDRPRDRPVGTSQIAWEAPAVTTIDDGFVVTFLATTTRAGASDFRATVTVTATPDGTGRSVVDIDDL